MNAAGSPCGIAQPSASRRRAASSAAASAAADLDHAAFGASASSHGCGIGRAAGRDLVERRAAEVDEQVVQAVGVAGVARRNEALELELELGERFGVEQLAQLLGAEELAQQIAVERERGRAPFGERRVALVHVDRDPAEQQRLRERRRAAGLDRHDAHLAASGSR